MQIQIHLVPTAILLLSACASTTPKAAVAEPQDERAQGLEEEHAPPPVARVDGFDYLPGMALASFQVKDMAAAKAWYARVLGSSKVFEVAEQNWCEITTPHAGFYLGMHQTDAPQASAGAAIGFGVADMDKAKAWLVKHGVQLDGDVIEIPGIVKLLYFRDPDGNRFWFYAAAG